MQEILSPKANILLIEDNQDNLEICIDILKDTNAFASIQTAEDGQIALDMLSNIHENNTPNLILMDLGLPKVSGLQLLRFIKGNNKLKLIPTLVFTNAFNEKEITQAYKAGANCCFSKPKNTVEYKEILTSIETFWIQKAQLPSVQISDAIDFI